MNIYNTLGKHKEVFKPIEKGKVKMYTCGPTVYFFAHIGNFSAYIMADVLRRVLEYNGYEVKHIMNITDVGHLVGDADTDGEDKMIKAAKRDKKKPEEIAQFYTDDFLKNGKKLNIKPAHKYLRATAHIQEMIEIIEILIKKGLAYESNGNVFFEVKKFKEYGKLSGNTLDKIKTGIRLEPHPDKKNPADFALWLKAPKEHLMQWDSPWSRGYPGWHIECSAMSMKYLGETLDIHTGGEDHLFPHHEDEIAQSEGATGKPFVNFWVHKKHILVNGEKMAKSKGNFYTIPDLEKREYAPLVYRFFILSNHYRSQTNFTFEKMDEAKNQLNRLIEFKERLEKITKDKDESEDVKKVLKETHKNFEKYINDDLNIPKALDEIFEMIKKINKIADADNLTKKDSQKALNFLKKFDEVLAILDYKPRKTKIDENEVKKLIAERNKARKEKNFKQADEIRQKLLDMGIEIKDTDKDTEWKVK